MISIPNSLQHAMETGNCVLFIGAGIGKHLSSEEEDHAPTSRELTKCLADHFNIQMDQEYQLSTVAQIIEKRYGRLELEGYIQNKLSKLVPDSNMSWLFTLRWRAIFTTNYDTSIETAYLSNSNPIQNPVRVIVNADISNIEPQFQVPLIYLHGTLFGDDSGNILITEDDYNKFKERRRMLFNMLQTEFVRSTILYIGYSNSDPNWNSIYTELADEFKPDSLPRSYRIAPNTPLLEKELLEFKGIETIDATLQEFVGKAKETLSLEDICEDRMKRIEKSIPLDLNAAFKVNPAAITRFLASWEYVNCASFHESANIAEYLKGDKPNWGLIGDKIQFERDIEGDLLDEVLQYLCGSSARTRCVKLLGSAGYGVTTLLMTIASEIINEGGIPVYMLKDGHSPNIGDIEYGLSLFSEPPIFLIDNASIHSGQLFVILHRLRETKVKALFIIGSRLNEWRQTGINILGNEYLLEPLSDPEILRLIDCLERNGKLGCLEDLKREHQITAIKRKHQKELIVTMREVTEGLSFDAILESEYRGIKNDLAQYAYLLVCCFYQYGIPIRDILLLNMLDIDAEKLYNCLDKTAEGVIISECMDEYRGIFALRARHRVIAQVVWNRCSEEQGRSGILLKAIKLLNMNYEIDKNAFTKFIRSDNLVDSISTIEGRIQYFEVAAKKDPTSPFVKQHYARMFLRANKLDQALNQIDEALDMNRSIKSLHHTKGLILKELAFQTPSVELARRKLTRSEACFRKTIEIDPRNSYGYHGLASLYLSWANRISCDDESAMYLYKSEEVIGEGLRKARDRDRLWIVSAEINKLIGDTPGYFSALIKAVEEVPGSIYARYVLARAYLRSNQPDKAISILEYTIMNDISEFRSFVVYAKSMLMQGKKYSEAIALMRISELQGYNDPKYIATLGGMLFLNGEFRKSDEVFSQAVKRNFNWDEKRRIQYYPHDTADPENALRLEGAIITVKAGYSFIQVPGYPNIICPASKYKGLVIVDGMHVSFQITFSAFGSVAIKPKCIDD